MLATGEQIVVVRTFATRTPDLLRLWDWLRAAGVTHVAIESTGVYWQAITNKWHRVGNLSGFPLCHC